MTSPPPFGGEDFGGVPRQRPPADPSEGPRKTPRRKPPPSYADDSDGASQFTTARPRRVATSRPAQRAHIIRRKPPQRGISGFRLLVLIGAGCWCGIVAGMALQHWLVEPHLPPPFRAAPLDLDHINFNT